VGHPVLERPACNGIALPFTLKFRVYKISCRISSCDSKNSENKQELFPYCGSINRFVLQQRDTVLTVHNGATFCACIQKNFGLQKNKNILKRSKLFKYFKCTKRYGGTGARGGKIG